MFFIIIMLLFSDVRPQKIDGCGDIPSWLTAPKTGKKAWDKCIEYQERYVFPCEKLSISSPARRGNYCKQDPIISNNDDFANNYYNYVVPFAVGDERFLQWICTGVLISESFILTTAFCVRKNITFVYLGATVSPDEIDRTRLYRVKRTIPHPEANTKQFYNHDIALVETEEFYSIQLNHNIRPACLHTGEPLDYNEATFISRHYDDLFRQPSPLLQLKMVMKAKATCDAILLNWLPKDNRNINEEGIMCYVDKNDPNTRNRYDHGCPLQVKSAKISCMEVIIGLKSLHVEEQEFFTRVSHYLAWIENVVWP